MVDLSTDLPNFRQVYPRSAEPNQDGRVFRSSRLDFLSNEAILQLICRYNIKCFIDFRSGGEYRRADGKKDLDNFYEVRKVKSPYRYSTDEAVKHVPYRRGFWKVSSSSLSQSCPDRSTLHVSKSCSSLENELDNNNRRTDDESRRHFLVDFFKMNYVVDVFFRASLWFQLYSLLYLLLDLFVMMFTRNGFTYFVRIFSKHIMNPYGIIQTYKDILDLSQPGICATFKLLADPANFPACINCAHGKDRTGIISALILLLMGVDRDEIVHDYAESTERLKPIQDRVYAETVAKYNFTNDFQYCRQETMNDLLIYLDERYGSVESYLLYIGVSQREISAIKSNLRASN